MGVELPEEPFERMPDKNMKVYTYDISHLTDVEFSVHARSFMVDLDTQEIYAPCLFMPQEVVFDIYQRTGRKPFGANMKGEKFYPIEWLRGLSGHDTEVVKYLDKLIDLAMIAQLHPLDAVVKEGGADEATI